MSESLYELWDTQKRIDNVQTINDFVCGIVQIQSTYTNEFDWQKYAQMYPDLKSGGFETEIQLYEHWIQYGEKEGRCAGIIDSNESYTSFHEKSYMDINKKILRNNKLPLYTHWCTYGRLHNLPVTDSLTHTNKRVTILNDINMFINNSHNIQFSKLLNDELKLFDWEYYLDTYPDVFNDGITTQISAFVHWIIYGKRECRIPNKVEQERLDVANKKVEQERHDAANKKVEQERLDVANKKVEQERLDVANKKVEQERMDAANKKAEQKRTDAANKKAEQERTDAKQREFQYDINHIPAYIINLKERVDKKIDTIEQMKNAGIVDYNVFTAYDKDCSVVSEKYEEYNDKYINSQIRTTLYNSQRLYKVISSIGAMGLIYTTIELFKSLQTQNANYVMICEDDIKFHSDFKNRFKQYKYELKDRDLLYLGFNNHIPSINQNLLNTTTQLSHQITYPEDRNSYYGTYGYICSKKFREKVIELGIDWFIKNNSTIDYGYNQFVWKKLVSGAVPTGEQYIMPDIFDPYCINKNRQNKDKFYTNRYIDVAKYNHIPYFEHTFVFIIPSYNNSEWIERNLQSIFDQTYVKWKIIYINDNSTDDTHDKFMNLSKGHMDKITYIQNTTKYGQAFNRYRAYNRCEDNDICIMLDGDDWLASPFVLQYLIYFMHINNVNVTYGHFQSYSKGVLTPYVSENTKHGYSDKVVKEGTYRSDIWRGMHLRVMCAKYLKRIDPMDFIMTDNSFIYCATDMVESFAVLELSKGTQAKNSEVLCTYNRENSIQYPTSYYHEQDKEGKTRIYAKVKGMKSYRDRSVRTKVAIVYVDDPNIKQHIKKFRESLIHDTDLFLCIKNEMSLYSDKLGEYEIVMFIE